MTRNEQKLAKAIKMLKDEYIRSQSDSSVRKPLAHALYRVWRYFDVYEKERKDKS